MASMSSYPSTDEKISDAIDRIKELLCSSIDLTQRHTEQVRNVIDRIAGLTPQEADRVKDFPIPPIHERSVFMLLNDLEQEQGRLSNELARIREQMP